MLKYIVCTFDVLENTHDIIILYYDILILELGIQKNPIPIWLFFSKIDRGGGCFPPPMILPVRVKIGEYMLHVTSPPFQGPH